VATASSAGGVSVAQIESESLGVGIGDLSLRSTLWRVIVGCCYEMDCFSKLFFTNTI
jgi:hypothetical protein